MRIRQGAEQNSLELRSGNYAVAIIGGLIGLFGAGIGLAVIVSIMTTSGLGDQGLPYLFLLHPLIFLTVGGIFVFTAKSVRTQLRRYGTSETRTVSKLGLSKNLESFDLSHGHSLGLHTDERVRRSKNGTRRYRESTLYILLRDGQEITLGIGRKSGFRGEQPLLAQAQQIAQFTHLPLNRTGFGAPPESDFAGPQGFHYGQPAEGRRPHWSQQPGWYESEQSPYKNGL